jgi:hypothetical protein
MAGGKNERSFDGHSSNKVFSLLGTAVPQPFMDVPYFGQKSEQNEESL